MSMPLFSPDNPISFARLGQVTNTNGIVGGQTEALDIDSSVNAAHCVNPTRGVLMTPQRLAARVCVSLVIASGRATRTGEVPVNLRFVPLSAMASTSRTA